MNTQEIEDKLRQIVVEHLNLDVDYSELKMTDNLNTDLGADSLDTVYVVMLIEKEFGFVIDDNDLTEVNTFGQLVGLTEQYLNKKK